MPTGMPQPQLLNAPLRSLKRSSRPGARTSGVCPDKDGVVVADATDVNDEPLPHNSCTAGEIGCVRSPAWNSERKIGSGCADAVCDVAATGVTARAFGKLERYAALSIAGAAWATWVALATVTGRGMSPPTAAIAVRVACEPAALA